MLRSLLAGLLVLAGLLTGCAEEPPPAVGDPCDAVADCAAGDRLVCLSGACRRLVCERSATCPFGAACVEGFCQAPDCAADADCPAGGLCFEGACRDDICRDKADCGEGEVCLGSPRTCQSPPSICRRDEECPGFLGCKLPEGRCEERCDDDAVCPGTTYCDGEFCRARCASNGDCPIGESCDGGRCVPEADCSDRLPCDPGTPHRHPLTCACTECLVDLDCGPQSQLACNTAGRCRHCLQRTQEPSTCTSQGLYFEDGCCLACVDDADCDHLPGLICDRGRCDAPPLQECALDDDCTEPEVCDGGWCVRPGSGAACDRQSACPAGEACYADGRCGVASERCDACPAPSRCVAEAGDTRGTCAGCTEACQATGCPTGQVCLIDEGRAEGYCADAAFAAQCG